jgi:hypothetical protein
MYIVDNGHYPTIMVDANYDIISNCGFISLALPIHALYSVRSLAA